MAANLNKTDAFMATLGVETYRVGGSVRDELLGRQVKDADYVVRGRSLSDLGNILAASGAKVYPLVLRDGQQGGFRIIVSGQAIEIMLPRTEISTGPRHQDFRLVIDPELPLYVDAQRRDFRFNALYKQVDTMAVDTIGELIDPLDGIEDLRRRRINVTHPDSFRDDPLRILRALRFISTLGYELGSETRALMHLHADAATGLTADGHASGTVKDELEKLLMGDDPATALRVARDTGVLAVAFPELGPMLGFEQASRYHDMTTDEHVFTALETAAHVDAPLRVRMALLYHDAGKPAVAWQGADGRKHYYAMPPKEQAYRIGNCITIRDESLEDHEVVGERLWRKAATRMNVERGLREDVAKLVRNHMVPCQKVNASKVRRARVEFGDELLHDLYLMRVCDLSGKGTKNREFLANVAGMEAVRMAAQRDKVPSSVKELEVTGFDLRTMGVEGRDIGRVLNTLLDEVIVDPTEDKLRRPWQLDRARRLI